MKKILSFVIASFIVAFPLQTYAVSSIDPLLGRVLLDVFAHGEAWYVNPQTRMRVYLGRPNEALERLRERTIAVSSNNIARVPVDGEPLQNTSVDSIYLNKVAGFVLEADDTPSPSWYVNPVHRVRQPLATPSDAWKIMRGGLGVTTKILSTIPIESTTPENIFTTASVKNILSADTLELTDGSRVRLLSVDIPSNLELQQAAMTRLREVIGGQQVTLERDVDNLDAEGRKLRFVFAGSTNLSYDLVRNGLAFHGLAFPNYKYAELLIIGGIDAKQFKRGFWNR